ncbi:hypothetical protein SPRG_19237 [Saprolegnia parasitica CBS 223.65]|uniref:Uncharacterized protein n=1 Tax=Saprolegnia parasitica (strain CBS 223.65) TaxID=695850 RepID=A0A067CWI6_SAPPC|nr:hypothetical protein SPRG_19237 [Saprolegnia parasitica CBS 223.65]KDO33610.1 hypothetical protein SPRG_19237 [Saprolegnia parasitica CBS 223.65]|eukprot:XP_012195657.1 hypothetical protein SPRG_19237 [Saprolegnia parasitica CBS 223.65]
MAVAPSVSVWQTSTRCRQASHSSLRGDAAAWSRRRRSEALRRFERHGPRTSSSPPRWRWLSRWRRVGPRDDPPRWHPQSLSRRLHPLLSSAPSRMDPTRQRQRPCVDTARHCHRRRRRTPRRRPT